MATEDDRVREPEKRPVKLRLIVAEACYAVLAIIATLTLDGVVRTAMWLFFIWLAAKTLIASHREDDEDR